jgi:hypothetical protein
MPLLAANRKDTGSKSIDGIAVTGLHASKRCQYGGIVAARDRLSRNRGHIAS